MGHQPAVVDDKDVVADLLDLGEDVGAEDHSVLLGQLPDQGADLQDLLGVQAYSGLIQDQDVWEADQRLGQPHPLAVALGQVADQPAGHVGGPGHLQDAVQLSGPLSPGDPLEPGGELQILPHRHVHIEGRLLRQIADAGLGPRRVLSHAVAVYPDLPFSGGEIAGHHIHGGGFPGAVWAQEAADAALLHCEAQVVHRQMAAVPLHQIFYFDHGLTSRSKSKIRNRITPKAERNLKGWPKFCKHFGNKKGASRNESVPGRAESGKGLSRQAQPR